MKKADSNPVDQVEVDQEAAQLVRLNTILIAKTMYLIFS